MLLQTVTLILIVVTSSSFALRPPAVLVTGANKGIGKAIVKKIVETKPDIHVFLGSRDFTRGEAAAEDLGSDRVTVLALDVGNVDSVDAAAKTVSESGFSLTAICNNAGVGFGLSFEETLNVNFWGTKRVCDTFIPLLEPSSRVVNIASASGPNFVAKLPTDTDKHFWTSPETSWEHLETRITETTPMMDYDNSAYGFSKACVNVYTRQLAASHPDLIVNSCTPGWIATDLTAGMGASNPPEKGTLAPLKLLFDELPEGARGHYFGSDGLRSPLDRYRNPGDSEYVE